MNVETTGRSLLDATGWPLARAANGHPPVPPSPRDGEGPWGDPESGAPRPAPAIVATVFLIGGEIMFFAALIFAFWVLRLAAPFWRRRSSRGCPSPRRAPTRWCCSPRARP